MKKNLVLLGMMGVGKSTLGKIVAKKQGLKFIDTDLNIEKKFSMSISDIFKKKGEDFFRQEEEIEVSEQEAKADVDFRKNNIKDFQTLVKNGTIKEDKLIETYPLKVRSVRIVPVEEIFEN